jgi:hypothetical protein
MRAVWVVSTVSPPSRSTVYYAIGATARGAMKSLERSINAGGSKSFLRWLLVGAADHGANDAMPAARPIGTAPKATGRLKGKRTGDRLPFALDYWN